MTKSEAFGNRCLARSTSTATFWQSKQNREKEFDSAVALIGLFLALSAVFFLNLWGHPVRLTPIPLVDPSVTSNATVRVSYAELIRAKADLSDFDCYACHERNKPPPLRFDDKQNLLIAKEHSDLAMVHGSHNRNNLCFNSHDENNLGSNADGRQLKPPKARPFAVVAGPTYRDWGPALMGAPAPWGREAGPVAGRLCFVSDPHAPVSVAQPAQVPTLRAPNSTPSSKIMSCSEFTRRAANRERGNVDAVSRTGAVLTSGLAALAASLSPLLEMKISFSREVPAKC
jgi:hypothetical protein